MSIYTNKGEPENLKEAMSRPNRHLWKISAISEVNNFLSRKTWVTINILKLKAKGSNPLPAKWKSKSKKYPDILIRLN